MARWLVTQGDRQFSADDLADLQRLAREGKVGPGDMIQPPGAADWLYAAELPELKAHLPRTTRRAGDDDDDLKPAGAGKNTALIGVLVVLIAIAGYVVFHYATRLPDPNDLELLGDKGLQLTEMLVTAPGGASLRKEPDDGGGNVGLAEKDSKLQLLGKRNQWYLVKSESGGEGWVKVDEVVAAYFFADSETRQDYDPIYNPDRYVFVKNSSWLQLPDQKRENITVFQFLLQNTSKFVMTDVVLLATIKEKGGKVLETKEIAIEGPIPAYEGTMVGTLLPDPKNKEDVPRLMTETMFDELAKTDPDLALRWSAGIEVRMASQGFSEANIDLLQVRAVPKKLD